MASVLWKNKPLILMTLCTLLSAGCAEDRDASQQGGLHGIPDKPCPDRPGAAKDWEGFLCNGNVQRFVPLSVTGVGLTYNSLDSFFQEGFGFGWRLNIRSSLDKVDDRVVITRPGGTPVEFRFDGNGWLPEPLCPSRLTHDSKDFFIETLMGGTRLVYRPSSRGGYLLSEVVDRNDNAITIQRDAQERETALLDSHGLATNLHWDDSMLQAVKDPEGRTFTLAYNQKGELEMVTHPAVEAGTPVERFLYDPGGRHFLIGHMTPGGMVTDYGYYNDGSLRTLVGPSRQSLKVEYTEDSVTQLGSLGELVTQRFENGALVELGSRLGLLVQYQRDDRLRVTRMVNRLTHAWEVAYNSNDDIVREKNPLGDVAEFSYDDHHNPTRATRHGLNWTFTWNAFNQITSRTNPIGETTVYQRDRNGNLTRLIDFSGRVMLQVSYNPDGTIQSITDRYGETTSVEYDGNGNISGIDHPAVGALALNYTPTGLLTEKVSALGNVSLTHDDRAALVELAVRANTKADGDGLNVQLNRDLDSRVVKLVVCGPDDCSTSSRELGPTGNVSNSEQNGQPVQNGECPCVEGGGP